MNRNNMKKPYFGVSAYPCNAWDKKTVDAYFRCFPKNIKKPATTVLPGPWGPCTKFLKRFIEFAGKRPHLIEIHISAETARRTGRNGKQIAPYLNVSQYNGALVNHDKAVLKLVDKRVNKIVKAIGPLCNEKTTVVLSIGLEDNLIEGAAAELLDAVKAKCGSWKVCRNPMDRQPVINGEWVEGHGRTYHTGQDIWNFDGTHVGSHDEVEDIGYGNALKLIKQAGKQFRVVYLWSAVAQGWRYSGCPYEGRTFDIFTDEEEGFSYILKEAQK